MSDLIIPDENQLIMFRAINRELQKRAEGKLTADECTFIAACFAKNFDYSNSAIGHKSAGSWAKMLLSKLT